jgi:colanic acid/amylovoran biosynthesis protein
MGAGLLQKTLLRLYFLTYPLSQAVVRRWRAKVNDAVVQKMKGCDFILFVGGGYINSDCTFDMMQMHHLFCLARESGRPVYLLGQTLGPFRNRWHRKIVESIFRGAERIVIREKYSRSELTKFSDKVLEGVDDAVDFRNDLGPPAGTNGSQVLLGLNLRPMEGPAADYAGLVQSLNRFNTEFAGGRLKVLFIPMETSAYCDDRKEAELFDRIGSRNFEFETLAGPVTVEDRLAAISKTTLFLGMRFHSLVFALSSAVPCAGLYAGEYYLRKNRGLFETYGMERYCLKTAQMPELASVLGELLRNKAVIRTDLLKKQAAIVQRQQALYRSLFT